MITENFDNYKTGGSHKEFNIEVIGTDIIIGNTNMLQESITLDEALCSDNNLKFGCCESSQFSVQVANIFEDFVDKQLSVSVTMDGITTKYGTFKVDSDKPTADRVWRVLTCYDKMKDIINANVIDWYNGLTFPMSQKAYRDSFFAYLGIEQVEVSLINDDFMVQGGFTATDTLSGKTIITSICEFNGVFGHINRDGKFEYVSLSSANAIECPPYENNSVTYEDYETDYITRVTMRGTASDVGTSVGEDGNEYIITNNPIIYGTEGTDELITALTRLLNKVGSISYRPYSVGKTIGNPCVELGDAITVNTRHQTINSYVIKRTLTGIQALRDKYSATGSKVYPVEVNSVREEISRTQGKMNILTRTVDEAKSQIIAIQTDLADNYLTSTQTQTLINQSASQIQATVTQTITAELPDMIDEQTGTLSNRITVVESNYTQLSNEIVMKVKSDGTVAKVALGTDAASGSNVLIKGNNIQLDGDVTITDGFKLTAGVIQSANYVENSSGMKIALNNGVLDTAHTKILADGTLQTSKIAITGGYIELESLPLPGFDVAGIIVSAGSGMCSEYVRTEGENIESVVYNASYGDSYSGILENSTLTLRYANYHTIDDFPEQKLILTHKSIALTDHSATLFSVDSSGNVYAPNLITTSNIGNQSVKYANSAGSASVLTGGKVRAWADTEGGNLEIESPNGTRIFQIDIYNNENMRGYVWDTSSGSAVYREVFQFIISDNKLVLPYISGNISNADYSANAGSANYLRNGLIRVDDSGGLYTYSGARKTIDSYGNSDWYILNTMIMAKDTDNILVQGGKGNYIFGVSAWSDSRLKENIKDSQVNALELITQIKMREFDFKDESIGMHQDIGYVAHELMEVIPEAVISVPVSDEMKEEYGSDEMYQVEDKHLIKYLVKAVQELSAELKQLKATN